MNLLELVHRKKFNDMNLWRFCELIAKQLNITTVSVFRFYRDNNLPAERKIELVKAFQLDPKILLK